MLKTAPVSARARCNYLRRALDTYCVTPLDVYSSPAMDPTWTIHVAVGTPDAAESAQKAMADLGWITDIEVSADITGYHLYGLCTKQGRV